MFNLKAKDELVFSQPGDNLILDDLIVDPAFLESVALTTTGAAAAATSAAPENQWQVQFGVEESKSDTISDKNNIKKIVHRDLERQRRNEMAQLHASLRSLLPLDYIKGTRSVSDHLQGAVDYIKHKQNHVQELKNRREEKLKILSHSSTGIGSSSGNDNLRNSVIVNLDRNGVEILINGSDRFKLSRVMQELMVNEINVVSCVSTKANERFLHKIQAEADNLTNIDLSLLQERLTHLIN